MSAADASGSRELGYRAAGLIDHMGNLTFQSGPQVRDEHREVWTTMNDGDRPDIRKRMVHTVSEVKKLTDPT